MVNRLILIAFITPLGLVHAQSGNSTISGTIRDASDAVVANAKVQITNVETGVQASVLSNEAGLYRVGSLVPGPYRVEADAVGFDHLTPRTAHFAGQPNPGHGPGPESRPTEHHSGSGGVRAAHRIALPPKLAGRQPPDACGTAAAHRAASSLASLAPGVVMIDPGAGTAENSSGLQCGRRTRAQPEFHPRWRQRVERRGPHPSAATHQPAGRCHAGVPRHRQQLLRRVRPLHRAVW